MVRGVIISFVCTQMSLSKMNGNKKNKKGKDVIRDIKQQSVADLITVKRMQTVSFKTAETKTKSSFE